MSESLQMTPNGRRLAGGTAVLLGVRAAGLVMGLAVSIMLARGLGVRALGTFATALALVHIGSTLTDFGLSALLVREGADAPTLRAAMLRWATRARIVSGLAVLLVLVAVTFVLIPDTQSRISVLLVVSTVPLTALTLGMTLLQQRLMLSRMALLLLIQSALWLAMVAVLFAVHSDLRAYAVSFVVYNAAYGLLVHRVARRALSGPAEPMTLRQFTVKMRDVVPLSMTFVLVILYYKLDALFVYRFAGAAAAGSYAVAYRFLDQLAIIPVTLGNLFLPLLSRRHRSGQPMQPMFERYLRITLVLTTPAVCLGLVLARPLIGLFPADYADAVLLLRLLLPAFVPSACGYVLVHTAIVHHRSKMQLFAACIGLFVNVALNLVFVPRYGARAAAVITLLTELGVVFTLYLFLRGPCLLVLPWRWLTRLAAVLAGSGGAALLLLANPYVAGAAFVVVFTSGVVLLSVVDLSEIRTLLQRTPPEPALTASAETVEEPADLVPEVVGPEH
ncbi:MAG: oligosaccharide flippase family protein [Actinomycetota bacterium]